MKTTTYNSIQTKARWLSIEYLIFVLYILFFFLLLYAGVTDASRIDDEFLSTVSDTTEISIGLSVDSAQSQPSVVTKKLVAAGDPLDVNVDYILVPEGIEADQVCIDEIGVSDGFSKQSLMSLSEPVCLAPGKKYLLGANLLQAVVTLERSNTYFYPFDRQYIGFDFYTSAYSLDEKENKSKLDVMPNIKIVYSDLVQNKRIKFSVTRLESDSKLTTSKVGIVFERPVFNRIATLITFMFLSLVLLSFRLIVNSEMFVQFAIALLFGLSGIKAIVVPAGITFPTIIDTVLLLTFMLLMMLILFQFWARAASDNSAGRAHNQEQSAGWKKHKKINRNY